MSEDNVLMFLEGVRRKKADLVDAKMDARLQGFGMLIPVIEKLRERGLSDLEIGRFFMFLGQELCASTGDATKPA
jgi:hypothetical protein